MAKVMVYYCKGDVPEELVTSVFKDPAFDISELEFPPEQADDNVRMRSLLDQVGDERKIVLVQRLDEKSRARAEQFASRALDSEDKSLVVVTDDGFSAVAIPQSELSNFRASLEKGGRCPTLNNCFMVDRGVLTVFTFVALTVLLIAAPQVKSKGGLLLLALAAFFLFVWIISFS